MIDKKMLSTGKISKDGKYDIGFTYGHGNQYDDGSLLLVTDDLRTIKWGGNLSMKFGPVTFDELLVENDDGSIESWGSNHPTIKVGRVKIQGFESYWIPLEEAKKAVAGHGLELVIKGNKVIGTRKMTARGD